MDATLGAEEDEAYNSLFLTSVGVASSSIDEMALLDVSAGGFLGSGGSNNSSFALNATRVDLMNHPAVQVHIYALYAIIFVVGLLGNVLVVFVVAQNRAMQTVTNCFIANLALSDILLCVLAVPFTPLYFYLNEWIFGKILCHLVAYSQGTSVYVSTLTLTSIAIDRFFVILYPFRPRMKMSTCCITICLIWLVALCATLPYGIFVDVTTINNRTYCEESWTIDSDRQIFGAVTSVMQFVVPFIIMAFAYTKVSLKLADRSRAKAKIRLKSCRGEELDRERKRRTNRMLIAMVTIFGASWLPLNVVNLLNDLYAESMAWWKYYNLCFFLAHTVAMSSTCYNVFLYAWLNDTFRKELKRILPCFPADGSDAITNAAPNNTQAGGRTEGEAKRQSIARLNNGVGVQLDTQLHHGQHQTDHHHHPRDQRRSNLIVQEVQSECTTYVQILVPDEEGGEDQLMDVAEVVENEDEGGGSSTSAATAVAAAAALATPLADDEQQQYEQITNLTMTSYPAATAGTDSTLDTCPQCRPSSTGNKASFLTFDELMADSVVSVHQHQL